MNKKTILISVATLLAAALPTSIAGANPPKGPNFKAEGEDALDAEGNRDKVDNQNEGNIKKQYSGSDPWLDCTKTGNLGLYLDGPKINQTPQCTKFWGSCYNFSSTNATGQTDSDNFWKQWPSKTGAKPTTGCNLTSTYLGAAVVVNHKNKVGTDVSVKVKFSYNEFLSYLAKISWDDDTTVVGQRVAANVVNSYGSGNLKVALDVIVTVGTIVSDTNVDLGLKYDRLNTNLCFKLGVSKSTNAAGQMCAF
jgi:hypothetical protein